MDKIISYNEKKEGIFKFENNNIWKNENYKDFSISNITLVGKYIISKPSKKVLYKYEVKNNENKKSESKTLLCYLDELEDINGIKISLLTPHYLRPQYKSEKSFQITGTLITFPDGYSSKIKLYAQLLVKEITNVSKEAEYYSEMNKIIELRKNLLELIERPNKQNIESIYSKLKEKGKVNFLIIASSKGHNGVKETDILNDTYGKNCDQESNKKKIERFFGFSTELDKNIIRTFFSNKKIIISEIKEKIEEAKKNKVIYDYLVFVKGGGQNMSIFNDTEFCNDIINLKIPFITAVGHSDDDCRLLCLLSDIDLITPTDFGKELIEIIKSTEKKDEVIEELKNKKRADTFKNKMNELESKNDSLNNTLKQKEKNIESLKNSLRILEVEKRKIEKKVNKKDFLLTIAFILLFFLMSYIIYIKFFTNTDEFKKDNSEITNTKVKKENTNNSIASKPKQNEKSKIDNSKKASTKKLQYSEDEVFTKLLWKGYKGEKAIYDFQKANGMPSTGKVDENLLKKLEIKIKYQ